MSYQDVTTIPDLFFWRANQDPERVAVEVKRGGRFVPIRWREFESDVLRATAVLSKHVRPGERVVHVSENRYEWLVADLAILSLAAIHVPLHATLTISQQREQALDAEPSCLICSKASALDLPGVTLFHYDAAVVESAGCNCESHAIDWHTALAAADLEMGRKAIELARASLTSDAIATILYTSGTTGESKGVVLSHKNLTSNAIAAYEAFSFPSDRKRLNFLPLSHIFARTCDFYAWLAGGYQLVLAETKETVMDDCQATAPHILTGVPYFYERVQRSLQAAGLGQTPGALRNALGGRIQVCVCGGAPLSDETYDFYAQHQVPLMQGYGLTETSPVITTNTPQADRKGSVGRVLEGLEVRIADDGEICTRGPNVMQGYWRKPEATAEVLRDGWFSTGDIGRVDEDGYLWITGRKKELIVTAAGKKIAPVLVESLLNQDPLISQSFVYGDRQKYLIALVVPDLPQFMPHWQRLGISDLELADQLSHPATGHLIETAIAKRLKELSHYEQVQKFCLLRHAFSVEGGELTGKLSMRRPVIEAKYAAEIKALYE